MLTIVIYHYVRPVRHTRYPAIRALDTDAFEGQLDYIERHYEVVRLDQVVRAARDGSSLPKASCLLTFDDGLQDHYTTVLPRLVRRGWSGCFFPVADASLSRRVLDVHKIQFILAEEPDLSSLRRRILEAVAAARTVMTLPSDETLWERFATPNRFDGPDLMFVKNALQRGLPQPLRSRVVHDLFQEIVTPHEEAFARELYVDLEQMQLMARLGMEFGGHGSHVWMDQLSADEQRRELQQSRDLLEIIYGHPVTDWTMCYPYGSYNETTLELAREEGCALGLTVHTDVVADLSRPLELSRLDTTDLPTDGDGTPAALAEPPAPSGTEVRP